MCPPLMIESFTCMLWTSDICQGWTSAMRARFGCQVLRLSFMAIEGWQIPSPIATLWRPPGPSLTDMALGFCPS